MNSLFRTALFTDVDDTFIDHKHDPAAIADAWKVREWADTQRFPIILMTGAGLAEVQQRLVSGEIPSAEMIVASVGTEIWTKQPDGNYRLDQKYADTIAARRFNRHAVATKIRELIITAAAKEPNLHLQFQDLQREEELLTTPNPAYSPHKVSLYFLATYARAQEIELEYAQHFPAFKAVVCEEINYNATLPPGVIERKFCLDIVATDKAGALDYLIKTRHIEDGWKAGDSGNDTTMLLHKDNLMPILVGGYKSELYEAIKTQLAPRPHNTQNLYQLKDGHTIYIENGLDKAASSILRAVQLGAANLV